MARRSRCAATASRARRSVRDILNNSSSARPLASTVQALPPPQLDKQPRAPKGHRYRSSTNSCRDAMFVRRVRSGSRSTTAGSSGNNSNSTTSPPPPLLAPPMLPPTTARPTTPRLPSPTLLTPPSRPPARDWPPTARHRWRRR